MSEAGGVRVEDEEGGVDKQTKQQVLNLRKQVDEDERKLYVDMAADPQTQLTPHECNKYWGVSIRQYLRSIKRLWGESDSTNVSGVEKFWKQIEIGAVTLVPPDEPGRPFSRVQQHEHLSEMQLRRLLSLPPSAEIPEPKTTEFYGLQSVLQTTSVSQTWTVTIDDQGPPPEHEIITLQSAFPVPKHILENSVEAADEFLQQAGIGFEIGVPDYMGGSEPGI